VESRDDLKEVAGVEKDFVAKNPELEIGRATGRERVSSEE
jgi:hypothetical protein